MWPQGSSRDRRPAPSSQHLCVGQRDATVAAPEGRARDLNTRKDGREHARRDAHGHGPSRQSPGPHDAPTFRWDTASVGCLIAFVELLAVIHGGGGAGVAGCACRPQCRPASVAARVPAARRASGADAHLYQRVGWSSQGEGCDSTNVRGAAQPHAARAARQKGGQCKCGNEGGECGAGELEHVRIRSTTAPSLLASTSCLHLRHLCIYA